MERVLECSASNFHYKIYIRNNALDSIGSLLPAASSYHIITDSNLYRHHSALMHNLAGSNVYVLPPGECTKAREFKASCEDSILAQNIDRRACVVAWGGGVIGDLAGCVAASVLRGLKLAMIPTSLLSMVDSSVGGKTAIDTEHGKNLIGSFHQPSLVIIDLAFIQTLEDRLLAAGMAEVIKMALHSDASLYNRLNQHTLQDLRTQPE